MTYDLVGSVVPPSIFNVRWCCVPNTGSNTLFLSKRITTKKVLKGKSLVTYHVTK